MVNLKFAVLLLVSTSGAAGKQSKQVTYVGVESLDTAANDSFIAPYYRNITLEEAWVLPRSSEIRQVICDCTGSNGENALQLHHYILSFVLTST